MDKLFRHIYALGIVHLIVHRQGVARHHAQLLLHRLADVDVIPAILKLLEG